MKVWVIRSISGDVGTDDIVYLCGQAIADAAHAGVMWGVHLDDSFTSDDRVFSVVVPVSQNDVPVCVPGYENAEIRDIPGKDVQWSKATQAF